MFFILIDSFYTIVSVDFIKNSYFILSIVFLQFDAAIDGGVYPFIKIPDFISHNVPAVYDVLPARTRALRSKDQGWQNVAEKNRTKGVARLRFFVARAALAAKHIQTC
jgi:hypothetical protein